MKDVNLRESLRAWAEGAECRLCVLFGSRSGERTAVKGDADVAVSFPEMPAPEARLELIGELQAAAGDVPVDVTFLHPGTDPVLRFEIFRAGEPVFEESEGLFVREKVRALMLYEDAKGFRRALRRSLVESAGDDAVVP